MIEWKSVKKQPGELNGRDIKSTPDFEKILLFSPSPEQNSNQKDGKDLDISEN